MIGKITSFNAYSNVYRAQTCQPRKPQVSFTGILNNPEAKKIKDVDGNTYIVEPNGTLIINKTSDDKNKQGNTAGTLATGAGAGFVGDKVSKLKSKPEESNKVETHKVENKDDEFDNSDSETNVAESEISQDTDDNTHDLLDDDDSDNDSDIDW